MLPTIPHDQLPSTSTDDCPRYFLDDRFDDGIDGDWWLDLGCVDLPNAPTM